MSRFACSLSNTKYSLLKRITFCFVCVESYQQQQRQWQQQHQEEEEEEEEEMLLQAGLVDVSTSNISSVQGVSQQKVASRALTSQHNTKGTYSGRQMATAYIHTKGTYSGRQMATTYIQVMTSQHTHKPNYTIFLFILFFIYFLITRR